MYKTVLRMTHLCKVYPVGLFSLQQRSSTQLLCMLQVLSSTDHKAANQGVVFSLPLVQGCSNPAAASQQQCRL